MSTRRELGVVLSIALAGTLLRFVKLGELSFSGDEEITTLAALALRDGWPPVLPGGLVYVRALPFTALESLMLSFGGTQELVLRVIPVLCAFPRILAIWWLARAFLPASLAVGCALLLAVAPFDIEHSRTARMYSPFATLDLLFVASLAHLALYDRGVIRTAAFGIAAAALHTLLAFHVPLPWLAALSANLSPRARLRLLLVGGVVALGFAGVYALEVASYQHMGLNEQAGSLLPRALQEHVTRLAFALTSQMSVLLLVASAAIATWLWGSAIVRAKNGWARALAAAAAMLFLAASPVLASMCLLFAFVLEGATQATSTNGDLWERARRHPVTASLAGGALVTMTWGLLGGMSPLPGESALRAAAEMWIGYPAPNWLDLVRAAPGLLLLAAIGIVLGARDAARSRTRTAAWLVLIGAAIAVPLGTGVVRRSEALRFQLHAFAPLLVLAMYGAWRMLSTARELYLSAAPRAAIGAAALAFAIALLAVRPDLGLAVVLREHGPIDAPFATFTVAPDHRGAGRYVREHANPNDVVVAEDSQQQCLYVGRVTYWLRRPQDARAFLTQVSVTSEPTDSYTGAALLPDIDALLAMSRAMPDRIVWLITSAEADSKPKYYRTPSTIEALDRMRPYAAFVGRDGITSVYRIRAGTIEGPEIVKEAVATQP